VIHRGERSTTVPATKVSSKIAIGIRGTIAVER
jgi:hypothetical protein